MGDANIKKNVRTASNTREDGGIGFESKKFFGHRDVLPVLIGNACAMSSTTSNCKGNVENCVVSFRAPQ